MSSIVTTGRQARSAVAGPYPDRSPILLPVVVAIGASWSIAVLAQLTGTAILLHHHTLIEGGPPFWLALPLFLVAWQVMVAAMMLPASWPAIRAVSSRPKQGAAVDRLGLRMGAFLAAYAAVWTVYGFGAFMFDVGLHRLVDVTPFLASRPWLIESTAVLAAGVYQFLPLKRRGLSACRHPEADLRAAEMSSATDPYGSAGLAARAGFRHATDCVVSCWLLMMLMFSAGFANVWWMAVLAAAMAYETMGRHGRHAAPVIGVLLLGFGALILATGWIPAFTTH